MTKEQRRQVIDFGKFRGTGMPVPSGMSSPSERAHILNVYFETPVVPPSPFFFWRNKNRLSTNWEPKIAPNDSSTQVI